MTFNSVQKKILNKLLDKYESSKSFLGENKVSQSFGVQIDKLFPAYADDARYDEFTAINQSLLELEVLGLIFLEKKQSNVLKKVILNPEAIKDCYEVLRRVSKEEENRWLQECWERVNQGECRNENHFILQTYISAQKERLKHNLKVEYYDENRINYEDLLKLVAKIEQNTKEQFIRDFSVQLFGNSKRVEFLRSKAQSLLFQYGDFQEKEFVFEECGIVKTPTYVYVKGSGKLVFQSETIELKKIVGDIGLSTVTLEGLKQVIVTGKRVITIENLTTFHDYGCEEDFVIYLGGFHNRVKGAFLQMLYENNPEKEYRHFGDIDAGGLYIIEHLRRRTRISFEPIYMDVDTLVANKENWMCLTENDRRRLEKLQEKDLERYGEIVGFMLEHGCKLEQEGIVRS